jgi:hypothetical protein
MARSPTREYAAALHRIAEADARIVLQEERVRALRDSGHTTAESERLLHLMRRSRELMKEQADLIAQSDRT